MIIAQNEGRVEMAKSINIHNCICQHLKTFQIFFYTQIGLPEFMPFSYEAINLQRS